MESATCKNDFLKAKKVFYEIGYYVNGRWIKSGTFKEIGDIRKLIKLDMYLDDPEYLAHHNFKLVI